MKAIINMFLVVILAMVSMPSWSHGDEDHGSQPHPDVADPAAVMAQVQSGEFEFVAQLEGALLMVYLNRYADNMPIANAEVEIDSTGFKGKLKAISPGIYQAQAPALAAVGEHALAITVIAAEGSDLLETTLKVAPPVAPAVAVTPNWWRWAAVGLVCLILLGVAAVVWHRRGAKV